MKKMNKKGFTLIEMLVVIAIIAILVAIIIPTVSSATIKAKEAADVANIRSSVAQYEIQSLDDPDLEFALDSGVTLNYPDQMDTETAGVVTYTSTVLEGGKTFTWNVGALLTEPTT